MNDLVAQVSLYPLGQEDLSASIDAVLKVFEAHGLRVTAGPMSTLLSGDDASLFAALHDATVTACASGKMVMVFTVSNACTVPDDEAR